MRTASVVVVALLVAGCASSGWTPLLQESGLGGFTATEFGGEGEVCVKDATFMLGFGSPLTGVNWTGKQLPTVDYELELTAARVEGTDFFCGLTFPYRDKYLTLVVGGWGGSVVGISSLDGYDASENETGSAQLFEDGRDYRIRLLVEQKRIRAWIDEKQVVDIDPTEHELSLRVEVEPSRPLGIASYETRARIRGLRVRRLRG